jgi:hypothetical protein
LALSLTLNACSSPQEKIKKLEQEIESLQHTLETQSDNYYDVATQQNIQIDLRDE